YGQVTYQGVPIDSQEILLEPCDHIGNGWTCWLSSSLSTSTQSGGYYQFTTSASLGNDQKYVVLFRNTTNDSRFLAEWRSFSIYSYTAGQVLPGGDFDIADMVLLSPSDTANVGLPVTFQWQTRIGALSDVYMFELYKPNDLSVDFTTPKLGYAGSYTLNTLPAGFATGVEYGWYVWLFGPSDSIGYTNQYHRITFH
ncbi:MAG TPA: hypothetical protein VMP08_26020, partial [Anaerolineae bacterium]|nr:hypothetical protein [Anaerolineae bacterium]